MMIPVVDVSKWQGQIDFRRMKSRGVQGVIIRLGNGVSLDTMAETYVAAARAAELVVGCYWFMNPKATATGGEQGRRLVDRARALNALDIPPMLDIEAYVSQPGEYPALRGQPLLSWQCDAAEMVRSMLGYSPLVYTNKAYTDSQGIADVGELGRCPLIVARYPWYYEGNPLPPDNASLWESWLFSSTTKRPQVPAGFDDWQGWQFSAGFNRRGAAFGASSADLDLNLIKPDAWAAWTAAGSPGGPVLYPSGYATELLTLDQLRARYRVAPDGRTTMEPEYEARLFAWLEAQGGRVGIGSSGRNYGATTSAASAANKSFHQRQQFGDGSWWFAAVDLVAADPGQKHRTITWAEVPAQGSAAAAAAGVHCNVGVPGQSASEPWHMQPVELDGFDSWVSAGRPRPRATVPPTAPTGLPDTQGDFMFIAQSPTNGRALVTPKVTADNQGAFLMSGILGDEDGQDNFAVLTIDARLPVVDWPDDIYAIRAERSQRLFGKQ